MGCSSESCIEQLHDFKLDAGSVSAVTVPDRFADRDGPSRPRAWGRQPDGRVAGGPARAAADSDSDSLGSPVNRTGARFSAGARWSDDFSSDRAVTPSQSPPGPGRGRWPSADGMNI